MHSGSVEGRIRELQDKMMAKGSAVVSGRCANIAARASAVKGRRGVLAAEVSSPTPP